MNSLKISLMVFIFSASWLAQVPDTSWTKVFGDTTSEDWGISFVESVDSGYVIVGATTIESSEDLWIFRTDKDGNLTWSKTYGTKEYVEMARCIKKTLDDNYIVCGTRIVPPLGIGDIWLLKFDTNGDTLWTKNYSLPGISTMGWSVDLTGDGGFIILGVTASTADLGLILVKTNSLGEILWTRHFEQIADYEGHYVVLETFDNNYILISTSLNDILLLKIDSNGELLWSNNYGGNGMEAGGCVLETSDSGYIVTGYANPPISQYQHDLWVFKTNSSGEIIWSKTYGTQFNESGSWVIESTDNGYFIVGERQQANSPWLDIWLLKINSFGDTLWTKTLGGEETETAFSLMKTSENELLILGWSTSFGFSDVWLIKLEEDPVNIEDEKRFVSNYYSLFQNYPNPFNHVTTINYQIPKTGFVTLKIYDVLGKEVATFVNEDKLAGEYEVDFDATNLPSGVYFYQLTTGDFVQTKKMILLR